MNIDWRRMEPTTTTKIGFRTLITKHFLLPNGKQEEYVTKEKEGSTAQAVIALTPENSVILAKQFRVGPEKIMYELPGGGRESGETPEQAVRRELREETGYEVGDIVPLGMIYKDAYTNTTWHYFFATHCTPTIKGQQLDETEFIEPVLVTIDELFELGRSAQMTDTEALFLAHNVLQSINEGASNNATTNESNHH